MYIYHSDYICIVNSQYVCMQLVAGIVN